MRPTEVDEIVAICQVKCQLLGCCFLASRGGAGTQYGGGLIHLASSSGLRVNKVVGVLPAFFGWTA